VLVLGEGICRFVAEVEVDAADGHRRIFNRKDAKVAKGRGWRA